MMGETKRNLKEWFMHIVSEIGWKMYNWYQIYEADKALESEDNGFKEFNRHCRQINKFIESRGSDE